MPLRDLNQAIDLNKRQPEYFWQRGRLLLEMGNMPKPPTISAEY
jgi:hypothetical protein